MYSHEVEILLAEHNPSDVEFILYALRSNGVANRIYVVRDGEEAMEFVLCRGRYSERSRARPPTIILLDLKLPRVGGLEVLRTIRGHESTRDLPVAILTSSTREKDIFQTYELGVKCYVQKPVDFDQFRECVKNLGFYWLVSEAPPQVNTDRPQATTASGLTTL